ncbi:MAG: aminotransferase class I/II-fold pyridoxal phosphate-dependent enzyme [Prevotella sp.]|nr:aminotransferase class I/II-fold pyridoxal phosphate-dependent enzyme [Bacteroides sp.]MCM1366852.1 aminotransferase class I/II-fold pyridoxal phosphate-dependent enzyme [Prevotella sp.]MCM1437422.1 aminotransferase class I/II-fold pyridoxal phosphate-dependent enzyme [Prevotella sp.]
MQAIILAAGMGRRLGSLTEGNTKCMLEVDGKRLIDRALKALSHCGLDRIVIVAGYARRNLIEYVSESYPDLPIVFVENEVYDRTNNIYSLWLAKDYLSVDDTILLESDLIFEDELLNLIIEDPHPNVALVAKYQPWMDGTMVKLDRDNTILNFIPKVEFDYAHTSNYYKTVNIYKLSRDYSVKLYIPFLEAYIKSMGNNEYYEQVLRVLTMINTRDMHALDIGNHSWYEIDDVQDLKIAEIIFASPEDKLRKLQASYGGYWRYPGLTDFCYLVNPYFPPQKLLEEIKASFDTLIREYPSGMAVNSLLGAKYFGLEPDMVCVGNGAAELIKELLPLLPLPVAAICPTFEEYLNRLPDKQKILFRPENSQFRYDVDNIIAWLSESKASTMVLVNPDNPSGNFISKSELVRLAQWCLDAHVRLIVDESFVDFSDDGAKNTLLTTELLNNIPGLIVVKSISKSYGVPGLRLGVVASGDIDLIAALKKNVAIWNINSVAEFYMQIFGKYESEYHAACSVYAKERNRLYDELNSITWLEPFPSQANFILAEIKAPFTAYRLALRLLQRHNILIKDCSGKRGLGTSKQYVRIAVRDNIDNDRLIAALKEIDTSDI